MKINNILLIAFFFLLLVVVSEFGLIYVLRHKPYLLGIGNTSKPVVTATPQENNSCSNWYAKYKHIDSTSTTTRGTLGSIQDNTKQTRITFTGPDTDYYVFFENDVTQVKVSNTVGEPIKLSDLKRGDKLKVVEQYLKTANNKESFSVYITQEK